MDYFGTPPPETENRGPELLEVMWTCNGLFFIFFVLRIFTRWKITRNLGMEDLLLTLGVLIGLSASSVATNMTSSGLGRHSYYLTQQELGRVVQLSIIAVALKLGGVLLPKLTIVNMLKNLMGPGSHGKWLLYGLIGSLTIFSSIWIVLECFQCIPLEGLWNPLIQADCGISDAYIGFATFAAAWSALVDLALALFPITIVRKLQIQLRKKIGICCVTGMGVFAAIAAAIKTTKLGSLTSHSDFSWDVVDLFIWACVEVNLVILCACFPSLPALYRFLTDKTYRMSLRPSKHKEIFSSMSSGGSNAAPASDTGGGDNGTESNFLKYQIYRTVDIETHWSAV